MHVGYDLLGRKIWQSDQVDDEQPGDVPDSEIREFEYNAAGRLTAVVLPSVPDPENSNTATYPRYEYKYDNFGNLTAVWDKVKQYASAPTEYGAKRVTTFTYNELHNQTSRKLPNNKTERKEYDEFGRITRSSDFEKQDTRYEYNNQGLLEYKKLYEFVDVSPADGENDNYPANPAEAIQYTYDNLGRQKQIIESRGTTEYYYDDEGRTIAVRSPEGYVRYIYKDITGRKTQTRSYATTADLEDDVLEASDNDITRVEYTYDELGRLDETKTLKRDGASVSPAEVTTNTYDAVGNRDNTVLANSVTADYTYDNCNRLTILTHSGSLSSFTYGLYPDGMRHTVTESLKISGSTTETHNITYSYDNLNRLTDEDAYRTTPGDSYNSHYDYDVVGNRTYRKVTVNGAILETEYEYDSGTDAPVDRLSREIHTEPSAVIPYNGQRVYAYASNGQITHYGMPGHADNIGSFKAFLMGLPSKWSQYLFRAAMLLLAAAFFAPVLWRALVRWREMMGGDKWRELLAEKLDDGMIKRIRGNTHTGRPLGSDSFISKLEKMVGRRLRPLPAGRPRKVGKK